MAGRNRKAQSETAQVEQVQPKVEAQAPEEPKAKLTLTVVETAAIAAAQAAIEAETRLVVDTKAIVIMYTELGIVAADIASHFVARVKEAGLWPIEDGKELNVIKARNYPVGRVANSLASTCSAKRSGEKLKLTDDGLAVIVDTKDKGKALVWTVIPTETTPHTPSASPKGGEAASPTSPKAAREKAAEDAGIHQAVGSISAQVYHLRLHLEALRPMMGGFVSEADSRLMQIMRDLQDIVECAHLDMAKVNAEADKLKVKAA